MICLLSSRVEPHSEHLECILKTSYLSSINRKCSLRYIVPKICAVSQPRHRIRAMPLFFSITGTEAARRYHRRKKVPFQVLQDPSRRRASMDMPP